MIQSKIKAFYGEVRTGLKKSIIRLEVAKAIMTQYDVTYEIEHFAVIDEETGAKTLISNSKKTMLIEEYSQFSQAVETMIENKESLTPFEFEISRLKVGLLAYIQTDLIKDENGVSTGKTVWELLPNDWELC
jgi:hypothetical protein